MKTEIDCSWENESAKERIARIFEEMQNPKSKADAVRMNQEMQALVDGRF